MGYQLVTSNPAYRTLNVEIGGWHTYEQSDTHYYMGAPYSAETLRIYRKTLTNTTHDFYPGILTEETKHIQS